MKRRNNIKKKNYKLRPFSKRTVSALQTVCRCSVLVIYLIVVALFGHGIPVALPVFHYSESVPLFHRRFVFSSSVFRCSWFYSIPEQKETAQKESPRSVCKLRFLKIWDFLKILRYAKKLDYFKNFFSLFFKVSIRQNSLMKHSTRQKDLAI